MPAAPPGPGELFDSGPPPVPWRERWAAMPRWTRRLVAGVLVLALLGAGAAWHRDRVVERELAERVALTTSLGVWASSSSSPLGTLNYFLLARNDGPLPVSLTAADGSDGGLRLRMRNGPANRLAPGETIVVPLSVRLTCDPDTGEGGGAGLPTELTVLREDGRSVVRRVEIGPASPLREVAAELCRSRPLLRDLELSGPVLRVGE